jgi:hypothetical protein
MTTIKSFIVRPTPAAGIAESAMGVLKDAPTPHSLSPMFPPEPTDRPKRSVDFLRG